MSRISRRVVATVGAAATILMLSTSTVTAADPDALTSARTGSSGASVVLGARSLHVSDAGRLDLEHGGGLKPPATDIETAALVAVSPSSVVGAALAAWAFVFVAGALASLRYLTRRSHL